MSNMRITLPTGVRLEGPATEVRKAARELAGREMVDLGDYYLSGSRGEYVYIPEMGTKHLMNAIVKLYREWLNSVQARAGSPGEIAGVLAGGPFAERGAHVAKIKRLMVEFARRSEEGATWKD
jgi:hypothetical protein